MFEGTGRALAGQEGFVKVKMTGLILVVLLCLSFSPACLAQERGYFAQMGHVFIRGLKNTVSFPWEIPATIKQHDQNADGNPRVLRDVAGFFDGAFRGVTRLGCGVWDVFFSVVPGDQNDLPLKPEAFF